MTKRLLILIASLGLTGSAVQGESTNRLHFAVSGFSIAPLEAPLGQTPQQAIIMFLPVKGDFAPNVNVQIQPYEGSLDEYWALSLKQFEGAGFKLVQPAKLKGSSVVFEYKGTMQGRLLHWYARAEKSRDRVYLVTATAPEERWTETAPRLKACVDSFSCDTQRAAAPNAASPRR